MDEPRIPRRQPMRRPPHDDLRRRRPADISRAQKKPQGKVLQFRNKKVPVQLLRRNENLIIYYDQLRNMLSFELLATLMVIAFAALFATAVHATNTNVQMEINRAQRDLRIYQEANAALNSMLSDRYTAVEIERMATERLGMMFPDPSQVINIEVHRQGGVMMNVTDYLVPQENYFWQDILAFLRGLLDRIFGGS